MPANGLRPHVRPPSARALAVAAAVVAVAGLAYLVARETPLFALRELDVRGAPPGVEAAVLEAAEPFLGESLVALDRGELRRVLEALPTVRTLSVDRAFPHTLRITVTPERPLALLRRGQDAWLLSARGRVLRKVARGDSVSRPHVWTGSDTNVELGGVVEADGVQAMLASLRRLPDGFPVRVEAARPEQEGVVFVLAGGTELRLGDGESLALKLHVAARVLHAMEASELEELAYLDVTVPERPVGGMKSQLSS